MTQGVGASLAGPGSCPSDQAPPGLDASRFDPSRYEVGQRLWMQGVQRYNASGYVTVSKVGRKWASLVRDPAGHDAGRVEIGSRHVDGGGYVSPGTLYGSEEEWQDAERLNKLWKDFRSSVQGSYRRPAHLDLAKLKQMFAIYRDSDGSGEAGETAGLDPKGDSVGPQGHRQNPTDTTHQGVKTDG